MDGLAHWDNLPVSAISASLVSRLWRKRSCEHSLPEKKKAVADTEGGGGELKPFVRKEFLLLPNEIMMMTVYTVFKWLWYIQL